MEGANLIRPIIAGWLFVMVAARSRPSPLSGILKTPHDWAMIAYIAYLYLIGGASLMGILPMLAFYMLTVQSLSTWDRLLKYLKYWNWALVGVSALAVASIYGLDLTGAQENEFTQMGRLAIGTWLHDNPNSLAHSIIVVVAVAYMLYFWKGSFASRFVIYPAMAGLAFYCAWETQSKGAYLVGAGLVVLIFVIGRPKWVQVVTIGAAFVLGISALSFLPRMQNMSNLGADEGVQGRLLAWEMARTVAANEPTGMGWKQFSAHVPWREGNQFLIVSKATHSSYVQIGADLGMVGMFFYLAGIWTAFYTVVGFKSDDNIKERCRRAIFILLAANIVSGWMINRQYHTEYFLLIAAAAAMHRLRKADELALISAEKEDTEESDTSERLPEGGGSLWTPPHPAMAFSVGGAGASVQPLKPLRTQVSWFDFAVCVALTWLTFWVWDFLLQGI